MKNGFRFSLVIVCLLATSAVAQVIDDMDVNRFTSPDTTEAGVVRGTATVVDGAVGKAVRFEFGEENLNAYFRRDVAADSTWNDAEGFSFLVKGDGSDRVGGLELAGANDGTRRYAVAFPLRFTTWSRVIVPWRDLIPELARVPFLDSEYRPSDLGYLRFGKWYYWRDYGAHSYAIDDIRIEEEIDPVSDLPAPTGDPLARLRAKLARGDSVTLVLMGDSLTDYRHWANREVNWPTLLKERLESATESRVRIINTAIGGTELNQNLILMPGWVDTVKADLVTVCFGYNDWSQGGRGPLFAASARYAVDRIRRLANTEVVLMTTAPAIGRWNEMEELAEAMRKVAKEKNAGIVDIAAAFHEIGDDDLEARTALFVRDKVHLGKLGHETVARVMSEAIRP